MFLLFSFIHSLYNLFLFYPKNLIVICHFIKVAILMNLIINLQRNLFINMIGLEWFNVTEELSLYRHLNGKIIILDFFTYCCINCMHILPDLDDLEKRFPITDGLVVIGVHSAKFSNEQDSKRLLSAIQRYNIKHPVVNDKTLSAWHNLGISCWPTLLMIGPTGELLAVFVGEGHRDELILFVEVALTYFKSLNKIFKNDLPLQLECHLLATVDNKNLLFPSKLEIFQNEQGENLIIADTGNNRILIMDTKGNIQHVIGGSNPDFKDGDFENARFNAPQGVCILDTFIYVADNGNHAIRKIDLIKKIVITVVGTGIQGHDYIGGKIGKDQILSSPWDLAIYKYEYNKNIIPILLIAMAGTHQIWALFLEDTVWWKKREYKAGTCIAIVGSGKEENRNNLYPHTAGLAQPSGLTINKERKIAFFADSESSAIRSIDLESGQVSIVCGANRNPMDLHDYGDSDGIKYAAKLQHPLGITWHSKDNAVYITDTYNHKIKKIDVTTQYCKTIYGDGKPNEKFSFDEPSGIAISPEKDLLYVADTNNHVIKVIDMKKENITTLSINISTIEMNNSSKNIYFFDTTVNEKGAELNISFNIIFFERDLKLNLDAPQRWTLNLPINNSGWIARARNGELSSPISIKIPEGRETQEMCVILDIIACKTTECVSKKLSVTYRIHQDAHACNIVTEQKQLIVK